MAARRVDIIRRRAQVGNAADRLRQLIHPGTGEAWDLEILPVFDLEVDHQPVDLETAITTALAERPDLKRQRVRNEILARAAAEVESGARMASDDHAALMDRVYRYQRHVYDPLRKLFLAGRDRLLERLDVRPGERVLEVGCGTARNLVKLHRRCPEARLYGLDASDEMLRTARAKLRRRGLEQTIVLRWGLAEELDPRATFGLDEPFDAVFFSYSLSMMPSWRGALAAALRGLRPGAALHVVDFWDQAHLPRGLRALLKAWLARYHVRFRPESLAYLDELGAAGRGTFHVEPIRRRYAYYAAFTTRQE